MLIDSSNYENVLLVLFSKSLINSTVVIRYLFAIEPRTNTFDVEREREKLMPKFIQN